MASAAPSAINRLLEALPGTQRKAITSECERVDLAFGEVLCESMEDYTYVYFPLTCCISLLLGVTGHARLEMGMIGNEGMLGATSLFNLKTAPLHAQVQGAGSALRMPVDHFQKILKSADQLQKLLGLYLFVLNSQIALTVACTHFHEVKPRLVRWLLMIQDRLPDHDVYLTHRFLANMLGVQRSAVSIAAKSLQDSKLIHYSRGRIKILNRKGMAAVSCECYAAGLDIYAHTMQIKKQDS